jgi:amino acid adenylation domain-containing protein
MKQSMPVHQGGGGIVPSGALPDAERHRLLVDWNRTAADYPREMTVHTWFEQQVSRTPSRIALAFRNELVSYAELNDRANRLAHHLRNRGIGREKLVGICVERSVNMVVAVLAVLKAGAAYVPLDPAYPKDRIAFILEDSQAALLVTERKVGEHLSGVAEKVELESAAEVIARENGGNLSNEAGPRNLAYVIYTSGSTGKPKGVQIEHRSVVNFLATMQMHPGMGLDDTLLAVTTLSFDIAGLELYLPLVTGGRLILASREEASQGQQLTRLMQESKATIMQATPATWRLLLDAGWPGNQNLKILCGGEALPRELAQQLLPRCRELWNMYGPTETTIWSTVYRVRDVNWSMAPIGRPIANTQAYILDPALQPVPVGVEGELWLGGDGVARGYYQRPGLTNEKFLSNPFSDEPGARIYRTGDLVRFLPEGDIEYLGRIDNQVKIRGFRIELGEIEAALTQHPAVKSVVVSARDDSPGDKRLVAYLISSSGNNFSASDLRAHLKKTLPDYMVPSAFVRLEAFPLTPNGKVDRLALPAPQASDFQLESVFVGARDKVEKQLVAICEEILGIRPLGVKANLFELGAHSLQIARVFMKISKTFGRDLPLALLFQAPTIEQLATYLRTGDANAFPTLVPVQPAGTKPPLFCVHGGAGTTYYLRKLAQYLGSDQPVYGLESEGLDGRPIRRNRVEEMAAHYISEIRRIQPQGPYYLGGYCFGGFVAYEMAQQLRSQGQSVALVALFNAPLRSRLRPAPKSSAAQASSKRNQSFSERLKIAVSWRAKSAVEKLRLAGEAALFASCRISGIPVPQSLRTLYVLRMTDRAEFLYRPQSYDGHVALFRGRGIYDHDPEMGWAGLVKTGIEIHYVGDTEQGARHEIVNEPLVQELARDLNATLASAEKPGIEIGANPEIRKDSRTGNTNWNTVSMPAVSETT